MNEVLELSINELKEATKGIISKVDGKPIEIPQPSWFRGKTWPEGSLMINWSIDGVAKTKWQPTTFSHTFNRPFGDDVNIWYGNSEMAANGLDHGWAEGALNMANFSLAGIESVFDELEENSE